MRAFFLTLLIAGSILLGMTAIWIEENKMGMDIYYYMGPALKIESPESLDLWEFREGELEEALYELNGEGDKSSATFYGPNQDREGYFQWSSDKWSEGSFEVIGSLDLPAEMAAFEKAWKPEIDKLREAGCKVETTYVLGGSYS